MPQISHKVENGMLTVVADPCDGESKISHMGFREKTKEELGKISGRDSENAGVVFYSNHCSTLAKLEELTDEEKRTGIFIRAIPADAAYFKVYFENKYCVWTHTMIRIQ